MRVIVTGANGFIGSGLLQELETQGCEIVAVLRSGQSDTKYISGIRNLKIVCCDMDHYNQLPQIIGEKGFDVFYHLAWEGTLGADRADYQLQMKNVSNALEAAKAAIALQCKKLICTGTVTEFVAQCAVEKNYTSQNMIYALCKNFAHSLLNVFCESNGIEFVWAILSNTFGKGKSIGNIISYLISNMTAGREVAFSSALQPYDCMYLEDTARALYLLAERETKHNTYFIGSGSPRILRDYLTSAAGIVAPGAEAGIGKRPDDNIEYQWEWFDTLPLKEDTGFECRYSFEEGVRKTVEWYRKNH